MDTLRVLLLTAFGVAITACSDASLQVAERKKLVWPFSEQSIWNTPIGSSARYAPANISGVDDVVFASSFLVSTSETDPLRPLFAPGPGPDRCSGSLALEMIRVPDTFVLTPEQNSGYGNSTSFVQPDGHTLVEVSGLARCAVGGPVFGFPYPGSDLYGDGRLGGQGGSGLSSLGGSLADGDLLNGRPVRHALKISLPSDLYFFDPQTPASCFRWPADRCDGSHTDPEIGYKGTNPELRMGSLLAVGPAQKAPPLKTQAGRTLFQALRDYGAYVAGRSGSNAAQWAIMAAARPTFTSALGDEFVDWQADVKAILPLLDVVVNNGPDSVGGGGATAAALVAPPIGD